MNFQINLFSLNWNLVKIGKLPFYKALEKLTTTNYMIMDEIFCLQQYFFCGPQGFLDKKKLSRQLSPQLCHPIVLEMNNYISLGKHSYDKMKSHGQNYLAISVFCGVK